MAMLNSLLNGCSPTPTIVARRLHQLQLENQLTAPAVQQHCRRTTASKPLSRIKGRLSTLGTTSRRSASRSRAFLVPLRTRTNGFSSTMRRLLVRLNGVARRCAPWRTFISTSVSSERLHGVNEMHCIQLCSSNRLVHLELEACESAQPIVTEFQQGSSIRLAPIVVHIFLNSLHSTDC